MSPTREWFQNWFGETYLALYPHRDEGEAEAGVQLLLSSAKPASDGLVLDLACGAGRHLRAMARAGLTVVGFDLSATLLAEARRSGGAQETLSRGDMRHLPFRSRSFATVTNFFTSFGYFASQAEDRRVAEEIGRVLRPGGVFLLDYLNAAVVRSTLVPEEERRAKGQTVHQKRWLEGKSVVKKIEVRRPEAEAEVYHERVRLYEPEELDVLLRDHELETMSRYGDYDGADYGVDSPRVILIGRRR